MPNTGRKSDLIDRLLEPRVSKRTEDRTFTGVPDTDRFILLQLDDKKLKAVCSLNNYIFNLVCNEAFWLMRVEQHYGKKVKDSKPKKMSYRDQYFSLKKYNRRRNMKQAIKENRLDALIVYLDKWKDNIDWDESRLLVYKDRLDMIEYIYSLYPELFRNTINPVELWFASLEEANVDIMDWIYNTFNKSYEYIHEYHKDPQETIKVLQWYQDHGLINDIKDIKSAITGAIRYGKIPVLKWLKNLKLKGFTNIKQYHIKSFGNAETIKWLLDNGFKMDMSEVYTVIVKKDLNGLKVLKQYGILPDQSLVNIAFFLKWIPGIKWLTKQGLFPNKEEVRIKR